MKRARSSRLFCVAVLQRGSRGGACTLCSQRARCNASRVCRSFGRAALAAIDHTSLSASCSVPPAPVKAPATRVKLLCTRESPPCLRGASLCPSSCCVRQGPWVSGGSRAAEGVDGPSTARAWPQFRIDGCKHCQGLPMAAVEAWQRHAVGPAGMWFGRERLRATRRQLGIPPGSPVRAPGAQERRCAANRVPPNSLAARSPLPRPPCCRPPAGRPPAPAGPGPEPGAGPGRRLLVVRPVWPGGHQRRRPVAVRRPGRLCQPGQRRCAGGLARPPRAAGTGWLGLSGLPTTAKHMLRAAWVPHLKRTSCPPAAPLQALTKPRAAPSSSPLPPARASSAPTARPASCWPCAMAPGAPSSLVRGAAPRGASGPPPCPCSSCRCPRTCAAPHTPARPRAPSHCCAASCLPSASPCSRGVVQGRPARGRQPRAAAGGVRRRGEGARGRPAGEGAEGAPHAPRAGGACAVRPAPASGSPSAPAACRPPAACAPRPPGPPTASPTWPRGERARRAARPGSPCCQALPAGAMHTLTPPCSRLLAVPLLPPPPPQLPPPDRL